MDFSWDPLPPAGAAYSFALTSAIVVLSPKCAAASRLQPNADDGPGTERSLWIGRLSEAPQLRLVGCGCGTAIYLSGSGGMTGDNLRYARHLAALGHSVLAPDTMAGPVASWMPQCRNASACAVHTRHSAPCDPGMQQVQRCTSTCVAKTTVRQECRGYECRRAQNPSRDGVCGPRASRLLARGDGRHRCGLPRLPEGPREDLQGHLA